MGVVKTVNSAHYILKKQQDTIISTPSYILNIIISDNSLSIFEGGMSL